MEGSASDNSSPVLVTGAAGFLGSHVVRMLQEEGYKVRAAVRNLEDQDRIGHLHNLCPQAKHKLEIVQADMCDPSSLPKIVEGCAYVHHLAVSMPPESPKDDKEVIRLAVDGTINVLTACRDAGTVKRVILTSSLNAMAAKGDETKVYTEKDWQDEKLSGLPAYPRNKILQEKAAWDFVKNLPEDKKFELVVLNPGFLMGPVQSPVLTSSSNLLLRFLNGKMPYMPKFCLNVCDVRDCAKAHVVSMSSPDVAGERIILAAGCMWLKEMSEILTEELSNQGYKIPSKELPNIFIAMASKVDRDVEKARFISSTPINADNTRQKEVLKITPRPKEQTVIDMAHSMIEHGQAEKSAEYRGRTPVAN